MTQFTAPAQPLTDGAVTLRLPSPAAGDVEAVRGYIGQEQLDGGWLPEIPLVTAEAAVGDRLDAWAGRPARNGPTFAVTIPKEPQFVGIVGLVDRGEGVVEMIFGIAPRWRGRGLASRAVRLAAHWALSQPGVASVELRIDRHLWTSQRVAERAGFALAGTVTSFLALGRHSRTSAISGSVNRGRRGPTVLQERQCLGAHKSSVARDVGQR